MSSSNKPILRKRSEPSVESLSLPKWDREGKLVAKPVGRPAKVDVSDVETQKITPPTVKELEEIRENAYNEGFEQGFAQGMTQGEAHGKQEGHAKGLAQGEEEGRKLGEKQGFEEALKREETQTRERLEIFEVVTESLKQQLSREEADLKSAMLALSMRIARQALQEELAVKPSHIQSIVHAAIQALPNPDERLTVIINEKDKDLVTAIAESHWEIETSANVTPGGCQVKSHYSYVDYTLEHRFDTAVSHLMSHGDESFPARVKEPFSEQPLPAPRRKKPLRNREKESEAIEEEADTPLEPGTPESSEAAISPQAAAEIKNNIENDEPAEITDDNADQ